MRRIRPLLIGFSLALFIGCNQSSAPQAPIQGRTATDENRSDQLAKTNVLFSQDHRIVDLTHPFDKSTIYWPTESGFQFQEGNNGYTDLGYYYAANRFSSAEHGGTHVDAPIHFFENRETVDRIPLERLIGEAALVDVSKQCEQDPDYQTGIANLREWEERHERQLIDVILLLRTGFGRRWPNRKAYLGTDAVGATAVAELHFPGLDPDAANWLAEHRNVKAVGIDTASIDYGQSSRFQSHVRLFKHNIPVFENVANLDDLPESGFTVIALPMKIGGGSGGPLRIVALCRIPETEQLRR
jgi:kynurenine formamidase